MGVAVGQPRGPTLPRVPRVDIQRPAPDQVATLIRMAAEEEPEFAVFLPVGRRHRGPPR